MEQHPQNRRLYSIVTGLVMRFWDWGLSILFYLCIIMAWGTGHNYPARSV